MQRTDGLIAFAEDQSDHDLNREGPSLPVKHMPDIALK